MEKLMLVLGKIKELLKIKWIGLPVVGFGALFVDILFMGGAFYFFGQLGQLSSFSLGMFLGYGISCLIAIVIVSMATIIFVHDEIL